MRKQIIIAFSLILCLIFVASLSGCINQDEELTPTIKRIKNAGELVVGTCTPFEPMEYINETGVIVGFDIDFASEIALELDVELKVIDMNFSALLNAVENGSIDMAIAAITINVDRSEQVLFSNPYLNAGQIIVVQSTNEFISSPEDLKDKTVGVQNGTTSEQEALKYTNATFVRTYVDYVEASKDLATGDIDAIITDYPYAISLTKNNADLKIVGEPFTNELYGIAIKKGEADFKTKIDQMIASGITKNIEDKWF